MSVVYLDIDELHAWEKAISRYLFLKLLLHGRFSSELFITGKPQSTIIYMAFLSFIDGEEMSSPKMSFTHGIYGRNSLFGFPSLAPHSLLIKEIICFHCCLERYMRSYLYLRDETLYTCHCHWYCKRSCFWLSDFSLAVIAIFRWRAYEAWWLLPASIWLHFRRSGISLALTLVDKASEWKPMPWDAESILPFSAYIFRCGMAMVCWKYYRLYSLHLRHHFLSRVAADFSFWSLPAYECQHTSSK